MDEQEKKEKVENLILSYLERKRKESNTPGDTLEGITKWWLELERIEVSVDQVAAACENLIQKGFIDKHVTQDGRIFYKSNKKKGIIFFE